MKDAYYIFTETRTKFSEIRHDRGKLAFKAIYVLLI